MQRPQPQRRGARLWCRTDTEIASQTCAAALLGSVAAAGSPCRCDSYRVPASRGEKVCGTHVTPPPASRASSTGTRIEPCTSGPAGRENPPCRGVERVGRRNHCCNRHRDWAVARPDKVGELQVWVGGDNCFGLLLRLSEVLALGDTERFEVAVVDVAEPQPVERQDG
eukprot:scaffold173038_cov30-Tisochrysis_lutea.AAC.2